MMSYALLVLVQIVVCLSAGSGASAALESQNEAALRETTRLFKHAYGGYMKHAFPFDELKPTSCTGTDEYFHGMALTLVDSLDSLAVLGLRKEFAHGVEAIRLYFLDTNGFDKDENVSVFETNIRILGGLVSAHILAVDEERGILDPSTHDEFREFHGPSKSHHSSSTPSDGAENASEQTNSSSQIEVYYDGAHLLALAVDLGRRLLPAFDTPTGIPYGTVNLRHGVPSGETPITCTACGGSFLLEFAALSRLTGDPSFERAAHRAAIALLQHRNPDTGLLGSHIDVLTGEWAEKVCTYLYESSISRVVCQAVDVVVSHECQIGSVCT
jgi:mannosidase alpha-like ER degradation enhancer 2